MHSAFALFVDRDDNLSVEQVEPFAWIDPFAEVEAWALKAGRAEVDRDYRVAVMRRDHEREVHHLRAQLEALQKAAADILATQNNPMLVVKP